MRLLTSVGLSAAISLGAAAQAQAPAPVTAGAMCADPAGAAAAPTLGPIKVVEGFGTGGFKADTESAEAQRLFDHGMRLAFAFNWPEAKRAFQAAQAADPSCATCVWGEAYAVGPTLNYGVGEAEIRDGARLARRAAGLAGDASPIQRGLIEAMRTRYAGHPVKDRQKQDEAYADALGELAAAHPASDDVAILAADAALIADASWYDDKPRELSGRGERARVLLERVLARNPGHTQAIHLYIHLTEWSDDPFRALAHADRLGALAPASSHLVHMPSHTYYRVGRYADAAAVNLKAVRIDQAYAAEVGPPGGFGKLPLVGHNIHFGIGGAVMSGDEATARELASVMDQTYPSAERTGFRAFAGASTYFVHARFDTAEEARALADPGKKQPLARALWRYARGEAFARAGDSAALKAELDALTAVQKAQAGKGGFGAPEPIVEIARLTLTGRAAALRGDWPAAVGAFDRAAEVQREKKVLHGDPPGWWFPVRRSLGVALLMDGKAERARWELRRSLTDTPDDPLTLYALSQTAAKLGRDRDAEAALASAKAGWRGDEIAFTLAAI
jgi:tetratricopeptide (TPR) repeat protein